jgi:hypothetical protein
MKVAIGGNRLGSGNKENVNLKTFSRSTHDLSSTWRSSMSSGTLVPFMSELALPGDSWDIDLDCNVMTLPTIGPLFGSYKVQLDVFQIPIRLYNAGLHMNKLGIGMKMGEVFLPRVKVLTNNHADYVQTFEDNEQINSSCIFKYLGISGLGKITGSTNPAKRYFNAVPYLAYWDIYKNYYANKQEERGFAIHTDSSGETDMDSAILLNTNEVVGDILGIGQAGYTADVDTVLRINFPDGTNEPDVTDIDVVVGGTTYNPTELWDSVVWEPNLSRFNCTECRDDSGSTTWVVTDNPVGTEGGTGAQISLAEFPLENIDKMRENILQYPFASGVYTITESVATPYCFPMKNFGTNENKTYSCQYTQEGLGLKTYQSDLFNNWIETEWIDGTNGINEVTRVDTTGDSFTIDSLNLAQKVYEMLNRVAISGGSYDDWLDAVYTHERSKSVESPVYHGSLIKELAFQEVVSNAETTDQPLGSLAGRGKLTGKNKGGKMVIKVDEPSYIMGIVSLTPRVDYSQGNKWDVNLETMEDFHKPSLDGIGYQDLITDQMSWTDTSQNASNGTSTFSSAGKQPAWINYMTAVNRTYGNFAEESEMFMTLNRRYTKNNSTGEIEDLTTYIDPTKFNQIFAQTQLDAQNFWVQISKRITARRKMSAKIIPNL